MRVALTRDTDKFLVLPDRYGIARKMNADLFISIHADSAENPEAGGGTVYTLSEVASDREAQRLAARENKSDIINGVNLGGADADVSSILIDLTQRETMNVSAEFAKLLLRESQPNMRMRTNSHRFASFIVLKAPDTPSVLFETGYLSNEDDVAFLGSESGRQKVAAAWQAPFKFISPAGWHRNRGKNRRIRLLTFWTLATNRLERARNDRCRDPARRTDKHQL